MKEIKTIINKMKNNKAPGITGVSTNMLKNLPDEALKFLTDIPVLTSYVQCTSVLYWYGVQCM